MDTGVARGLRSASRLTAALNRLVHQLPLPNFPFARGVSGLRRSSSQPAHRRRL